MSIYYASISRPCYTELMLTAHPHALQVLFSVEVTLTAECRMLVHGELFREPGRRFGRFVFNFKVTYS
jgi:hypothetical protein